MFVYEFFEIFKNRFFHITSPMAASRIACIIAFFQKNTFLAGYMNIVVQVRLSETITWKWSLISCSEKFRTRLNKTPAIKSFFNNVNGLFHVQVNIYLFRKCCELCSKLIIKTPERRQSSLIYNTSARHERHECNTSATRVWHKCDMSATLTTRVRHEWKILILITTRGKTYFPTLMFSIW